MNAEVIRSEASLDFPALSEQLPELGAEVANLRASRASISQPSVQPLEERLPSAIQKNIAAPVEDLDGSAIFARSWEALRTGANPQFPAAQLNGRRLGGAKKRSRKVAFDPDVGDDDMLPAPGENTADGHRWKNPSAEDNGIDAIIARQRAEVRKKKEGDLRIRLIKWSKDPSFTQDFVESGLSSEITPAKLRKADYDALRDLEQQMIMCTQTSLDTTPFTAVLKFGAHVVEGVSVAAFNSIGTVPLFGFEKAVSEDPNIAKTIKQLAYQNNSFSKMDPSVHLMMQLPGKAMETYNRNKEMIESSTRTISVSPALKNKYKDLL